MALCSGVQFLSLSPRRCAMSYDHRTVGFDALDSLKNSCEKLGWTLISEELTSETIITDYCAHNCHCAWHDPFDEGPCEHMRWLRTATFRVMSTKQLMIAEEWLAEEDHDCDGTDVVKLVVYPKGCRPRLVKQIVNPSLFETNPELFES